ncbi:uncharacterized protein LOC131061442 isoform X5 [Cryptomeria japonica]|uniref:uncharacterized protein LOC131061442 isoform X5 n=1 Tax=Cryptomeria japonica TaxID=3369 RepID=UPI0027DA8302|nr:uncharacterized protein LOC131061442 isoform X5 [Cryptomeria japonica]XP_059065701.1 uncharacterized protein LOC131061442 isoform X5 [Cryptomeria japonica]
MSIAVSQMLIAYKSTLENNAMSLSSKEKTTLAAPSLHKQVIPNKGPLPRSNTISKITPSHEHIRKRCLTNMEASAPDATSPQQHTIKRQISNIEQQNFAPFKMQPHKSEHKKSQQMDSFKQHNRNVDSTKQQNPNPQPHTSKRSIGHMECD